ncbi:hypothetical protein T265_05749 [Opisthorchis viverrini]|uniref:Uncharacterized protein n=1 Tax=Opisthorchis viverrini TaxID=6198 RepID=A0A074ZIJ1_OPIVI|nr:hypothetical protein T265_05749 [Opisthorchis viverrini]KER27128.1 hypothetical protein T265_05749 [Opisthorchis viverrini]
MTTSYERQEEKQVEQLEGFAENVADKYHDSVDKIGMLETVVQAESGNGNNDISLNKKESIVLIRDNIAAA